MSTVDRDPDEGQAAPRRTVVLSLAAGQCPDLHRKQWSPWLQGERDGMSWIKTGLHSGSAMAVSRAKRWILRIQCDGQHVFNECLAGKNRKAVSQGE